MRRESNWGDRGNGPSDGLKETGSSSDGEVFRLGIYLGDVLTELAN